MLLVIIISISLTPNIVTSDLADYSSCSNYNLTLDAMDLIDSLTSCQFFDDGHGALGPCLKDVKVPDHFLPQA